MFYNFEFKRFGKFDVFLLELFLGGFQYGNCLSVWKKIGFNFIAGPFCFMYYLYYESF